MEEKDDTIERKLKSQLMKSEAETSPALVTVKEQRYSCEEKTMKQVRENCQRVTLGFEYMHIKQV